MCNQMLGAVKDRIETLESAARYLRVNREES